MWRFAPNARSVVAGAAALTLALSASVTVEYYGRAPTRAPVVHVRALATIAPSTIVETTTTAPRLPDRPPRADRAKPRPVVMGTGACGGDLPPCWRLAIESHGNLRAVNPTGCGGRGCYGKWQFDPRTWLACWGRSCAGLTYQGYARADEAPEAVQDARAREVWNGGRGCAQWHAC